MEHLIKLLRDSYDLQEQESEKSAYWHLQQLRSDLKQLILTDVSKSVCVQTGLECGFPCHIDCPSYEKLKLR
jgi:hypothetical protein